MNKATKIILITCLVFFLIGIAFLAVAVSMGGVDVFTNGITIFGNNRILDSQYTTATLTQESNELTINLTNLAVKLEDSPDGKIYVKYIDKGDNATDMTYENGELTLALKKDIQFNVEIGNDEYVVVIKLPKTYTSNMNVVAKNSVFSAKDREFKSQISFEMENSVLNLEEITTTSKVVGNFRNVLVNIEDIMSTECDYTTENGIFNLDYCKAINTTLHFTNGISNIDKLDSNNINVNTTNCFTNIKINGNKQDYKITQDIKNGSSNIDDSLTGNKSLYIKGANSAVDVKFD